MVIALSGGRMHLKVATSSRLTYYYYRYLICLLLRLLLAHRLSYPPIGYDVEYLTQENKTQQRQEKQAGNYNIYTVCSLAKLEMSLCIELS